MSFYCKGQKSFGRDKKDTVFNYLLPRFPASCAIKNWRENWRRNNEVRREKNIVFGFWIWIFEFNIVIMFRNGYFYQLCPGPFICAKKVIITDERQLSKLEHIQFEYSPIGYAHYLHR
jgi:hypothetical protein